VSELLNMRGVTVELPTVAGVVRPVNEVSLRIAKGECVGLIPRAGQV
jgi:ABC-type antimicrobial peptide transport system ATPase subunit